MTFSKMKPAEKFAAKWKSHGATGFAMEREYRFHPLRRWRFDFAWPDFKLAVEIDGFGYGHLTQAAIDNQNEKSNSAIEMGWFVLRFGSRMISSHAKCEEAVNQVCRILEMRMEGVEEEGSSSQEVHR